MLEQKANIWEKDKNNFQTIVHHNHSATHRKPGCFSMSYSSGSSNCSVFIPAPWDIPSLGQTMLAGGGSPQYIFSDLSWHPSHSSSYIVGNRKCSVAGYSQRSDSMGEWDIATLVSWGRHKSQCCTISKKQLLGKISGNGCMLIKVYFSRLRRRLQFFWTISGNIQGKKLTYKCHRLNKRLKSKNTYHLKRINTISKG